MISSKGSVKAGADPSGNGSADFFGGFSIRTMCLPGISLPSAARRNAQVLYFCCMILLIFSDGYPRFAKSVHCSLQIHGNATVRWICTVGNVTCIMAFTLALMLSFTAAGTLDVNIFVLAPLLLLLNQDSLLFRYLTHNATVMISICRCYIPQPFKSCPHCPNRNLTNSRRYFAPAASIIIYLGAHGANQVLTGMPHTYWPRVLECF